MRTIEQVAADPEKGDKVIMRTGHVRYEVLHKHEQQFVEVVRSALRTGPYSGPPDPKEGYGTGVVQELIVCRETWWDLVTYGASALE